jgi:hypothetical protein
VCPSILEPAFSLDLRFKAAKIPTQAGLGWRIFDSDSAVYAASAFLIRPFEVLPQVREEMPQRTQRKSFRCRYFADAGYR